MTVFKTFLKVLNKCKAPIIMYTVMLIFFGGFNITTSENSTNFIASKPDILIINNDEDVGITKDLIQYIKNRSNIKEIKDTEEARNDALFYRDVNYIIYIPQNFRKEFLENKDPKIEIKSTGDYQASLAEMMLERYIKVAKTYNNSGVPEEKLIELINSTLEKEVEIQITSKLDTNNLSKATSFYNFMNYAMLAGTIYVICLILSSFKEEKIQKRTQVSSMNYKKYNRQLLLSNGVFAIALWLVYIILSFILVGNIMFSIHGILYIINSFIFTMCTLTIAFLIGNIVNNKNAINGIINVIALGSSFLCGAFVPMEWLPDIVIKIAHILPSYYFIKSNEIIKTLEVINIETLKPILINMGILMIFATAFVAIANIASKKKK